MKRTRTWTGTDTLSLVWLVDEMPTSVRVSLAELRASLRAVLPRYEIVLVTRDVASLSRHFVGADPHIAVVVPPGGGEGAAFTAGCAAITGEYVLVISGDVMPDWAALPPLVPFLAQSDIVAAFRVGATASGETKSLPDAFTPAALAFLFGVTLRDPFNPAKLYRAELLRGLTFVSSGAALSLELLAKARAQGAIVTEVGIPAAKRTPDASAPLWAGQAMQLWLHLRRFRAPWTVRAQPAMLRPPSVYVGWGAILAAFVWFVRGWFTRTQGDRG